VYGTAREVDAERTLTLNYRDTLADAFMEVLAPVKPDAEVTEQELAEKDLFLLGNAENNALVARLVAEKKLPVEIGRRFFRWQGKTYGRPDDGLALALPNPWNSKRVLYLYLANSGPQLWQMTRALQRDLQGWALFRNNEASTKGYHELDALAVDLPVEAPAPEVKPLGSAGAGN